MQGSTRFGFWIAALFAAGVAAVYLFGSHESWFVRAAQDNAVRCLTQSPCARLDSKGTLTAKAKPPLTSASICAERKNWRQLVGVSNGQTSIVLTCTDGKTFVYHFGALKDKKAAGAEQWMACAEEKCTIEGHFFR